MRAITESHENFARDEELPRSSDRQFGLVFAAMFTIVAVWPLVGGRPVRWWSVAVAAVFMAIAVAVPALLAPLNRVWIRIGLLLHQCVSPIMLGMVFFASVTPIGLVLRALGKDPLRLRFDPEATTYWIERRPPGPSGATMPNQF